MKQEEKKLIRIRFSINHLKLSCSVALMNAPNLPYNFHNIGLKCHYYCYYYYLDDLAFLDVFCSFRIFTDVSSGNLLAPLFVSFVSLKSQRSQDLTPCEVDQK